MTEQEQYATLQQINTAIIDHINRQFEREGPEINRLDVLLQTLVSISARYILSFPDPKMQQAAQDDFVELLGMGVPIMGGTNGTPGIALVSEKKGTMNKLRAL